MSPGGRSEIPVGLRAVSSAGRSYGDGGGLPGNGELARKKMARARNRCTYVRQHNELRYGGKQLSAAPRTDTAARATCAYSYAAHAATMFFSTFFALGGLWTRPRHDVLATNVGHPIGGIENGLKSR